MLRRRSVLSLFLVGLLAAASIAHAVPGQGTLYGTDASNGNLITVDPTTGVGTIVGLTFVLSLPSLATDPSDGTLYGVQGGGTPELYTLNPMTGAATLVGDTGLGIASVTSLDFDAAGVLYASANIAGDGGTGGDHLATINTITGAATIIGPYGTCMGVMVPSNGTGSCTIEGMEGIAFDNAGVLWGTVSARRGAGTPGLYTIDPATGSATFVAALEDGAMAPASGGFVSLQFACDGTLYGGTARAQGMATDGGFLATIDPMTGTFSYVGAVSATTGGVSLGALAFAETCPVAIVRPIPSLAPWGILLLAGLLLAAGVWRLGAG